MMYRSEKYLSFIRSLPCCMCGSQSPNDPHHEGLHAGGMGLKAPDSHCVPLCRSCHTLHDTIGAKSFWRKHDVKMLIIKYLTMYIERNKL